MAGRSFFFAGGGTGGHIYPAIAVAEKIAALKPGSAIHFFISSRDIDKLILDSTLFEYTVLPAAGFSVRPADLLGFCRGFFGSCRLARDLLTAAANPVVVGVGGFVAAPACWTAHKLHVPIALLNVDIIPGRANKLIARWADRIFAQFDDTAKYFPKAGVKFTAVGCPLRSGFDAPNAEKAKAELGLDAGKKILLITGASSGSQNINRAICSLLPKLNSFADSWQIVHLTGRANFDEVKAGYAEARIAHKVTDYYDDMADLLAAADLLIGRSGAVSVAEYAAMGVPSICMPYPYHKDMHQYLNAGKLVEAGAAVIVDDVSDEADRAQWLWEELEPLMAADAKLAEMRAGCGLIGKKNAALRVAEEVLRISAVRSDA